MKGAKGGNKRKPKRLTKREKQSIAERASFDDWPHGSRKPTMELGKNPLFKYYSVATKQVDSLATRVRNRISRIPGFGFLSVRGGQSRKGVLGNSKEL